MVSLRQMQTYNKYAEKTTKYENKKRALNLVLFYNLPLNLSVKCIFLCRM